MGELNQFNGAMINSPFRSGAGADANLIAVGSGTMKGLKYTRYAKSRQSLAALYGADDITVANGSVEFLSRLSDLPNCGKVPIYRSQIRDSEPDKSAKKSTWLNLDAGKDLRTGFVIELITVSWKQLPFNAADFVSPQGYKRINNLGQVAYSRKQKDQFNEVLDGIGFASEQGEKNKKQSSPPGRTPSKSP